VTTTAAKKPIETFPDEAARAQSGSGNDYFDVADLDIPEIDLGFDLPSFTAADLGLPEEERPASPVRDLEQLDPEKRAQAVLQLMGAPRKIRKAHGMAATHALGCAQRLIQTVAPGEQCRVICPGTFVFGDLLTNVAGLARGPWKLTVATLSFGETNTDSLHAAFEDGHLSEFSLIVSDYFYNNNLWGDWRDLVTALPRAACRYAVAGIHAKVAILENAGESWLFEGSANLRSCRNIEQLTVSRDDAEGVRFHRLWTDRIFEKFELDGRCKLSNARVWSAIRGE